MIYIVKGGNGDRIDNCTSLNNSLWQHENQLQHVSNTKWTQCYNNVMTTPGIKPGPVRNCISSSDYWPYNVLNELEDIISIYQLRMKMTSTNHRSTPGARILCGVSGEITWQSGNSNPSFLGHYERWFTETSRFQSIKENQMWADIFLDHSSFNQGASANFNVDFIIRSKDCVSVSSPRYATLTSGIFTIQVDS